METGPQTGMGVWLWEPRELAPGGRVSSSDLRCLGNSIRQLYYLPTLQMGKLTRESRFLPLSNQRRHTRDAFNGMIIMILVNTSSFPRATHCARCFPCIHLVHPLKGPLQERSERVSDLPEVTQQASGRGSLGPRQAASRSPRPQSPELNGSPPPTPSSGVCFEVCSLPGI